VFALALSSCFLIEKIHASNSEEDFSSLLAGYESSDNKLSYISHLLFSSRIQDVARLYSFCKVEDRGHFLATVKNLGQDQAFVKALPSQQVAPALNILKKVDRRGISGYDLSERKLQSFKAEGVNLTGVDLSGSDITGDQLTQAGDLTGAKLSGINLEGFDPRGRALYNVNFSGSNITPEQLARAGYIGYCNLSNTGVTKESLQRARQALGKDTPDLDTIVFSQ